jgi:hypothetical protein
VNPNALQALQQWYLAQCDGDWEHGFGVSITTLDNPGWSLDIDLSGTELESRTFEPIQSLEHEAEWVSCKRTGRQFQGRGGPLMLDELISIFLRWAESSSPTEAS